MLTSLVVVAPEGAYWPNLEIKLVPDAGAPLSLLGLTGLEPVAAAVSTQTFGAVDGEFPTGTKIGKRNLVAKLGLLTPNARDTVYGYFLPKNFIKLRLTFDDRPYVEIDGIVESTPELDRFSESPTLPAIQVSIICPKPYFLSTTKIVSGVTGISQATAPEEDLLYLGTVGGGFYLEIEVGDEVYTGDLHILSHVADTTDYRRMEFESLAVIAGWKMTVNTHHGEKRAEFLPPEDAFNPDPISMLGYMVDTYFWTQLYAAMNKIQVVTPGSAIPRAWTLIYVDQFAGV